VEIGVLDVNVTLVDGAMGMRGQALPHEVTQIVTEVAALLHPPCLSCLGCSNILGCSTVV
jgi:hypothetical protein